MYPEVILAFLCCFSLINAVPVSGPSGFSPFPGVSITPGGVVAASPSGLVGVGPSGVTLGVNSLLPFLSAAGVTSGAGLLGSSALSLPAHWASHLAALQSGLAGSGLSAGQAGLGALSAGIPASGALLSTGIPALASGLLPWAIPFSTPLFAAGLGPAALAPLAAALTSGGSASIPVNGASSLGSLSSGLLPAAGLASSHPGSLSSGLLPAAGLGASSLPFTGLSAGGVPLAASANPAALTGGLPASGLLAQGAGLPLVSGENLALLEGVIPGAASGANPLLQSTASGFVDHNPSKVEVVVTESRL